MSDGARGHAEPPRSRGIGPLYVFAQHGTDEAFTVDAWVTRAARHFAMRVGATDVAPNPATGFGVVVSVAGRAPGIRRVRLRALLAADLDDADRAEAARGGGGLAALARRCRSLWVVERTDGDDVLALRLAALIASVVLGPIYDPAEPALFGVKTARERIDRADARRG